MPCSCCHHALRSCQAKRWNSWPSGERALHHVVPAAALLVAAVLRHERRRSSRPARRSSVLLGRMLCMRIRFQAIFRLCPTTARFCCQPQVWSVAPVLVELLLHERAVVVVREVLGDGVAGVDRACRRARVRRSPAHRLIRYAGAWSPTEFQFFFAAVAAERLGARVEGDRVDVREVAAAARGRWKYLSNRLRVRVDVRADRRVAGDAVGLGRAGQRVDLLVGRDRVVVVAELRGEDLALVAALHVDGVVPVDDVLVLVVDEAQSARGGTRCPSRRPRGSVSSPVSR